MQLILLALALGIFAWDAEIFPRAVPSLTGGWLLAVVLIPKLFMGGVYWWACHRAYQRLGTSRGRRAVQRVTRLSVVLPLLQLASYGLDLWAGLLPAVRGEATGELGLGPRDTILLDELAVMAPTLLLMVFGWWAYYPLDRAIRERSILQRADLGLPLYPLWSRGQYVVTQVRNQAGLILGPLLFIMAWSELVIQLTLRGHLPPAVQLWLTPVGAGVIFLLAPFLVRSLLDTVKLPPGTVRDKLESLCQQHRIGLRDLLLWRTHGGVINAAVMGVFPPLRYVLLTDGLLDQLEEEHVEAVMAHELGHVKKRHLWTLLLHALALLIVLSVGHAMWVRWLGEPPLMTMSGLLLVGTAVWAGGFGWVSRRIEQQADRFAAEHMSRAWRQHMGLTESATKFEVAGVAAMTGALQRVADLNHLPAKRRSYRHGSIAGRQRNLRALVGRPLRPTADDRVLLVCHGIAAAVCLGGALAVVGG